MIALRLTVPVACWRRGMAREYLETEELPPPATCYGALLSFVGEEDRSRHVGCRITAGVVSQGAKSTVLRTVWRIKEAKQAQGTGSNARPDFQELMLQNELVIWCDSSGEQTDETLEERVRLALNNPEQITRFGGWSLGESAHLINDVWAVDGGVPPDGCRVFLVEDGGDVTLPVWVDHVGSAGTRFAVGRVAALSLAPTVAQLAVIQPN